VQLADKDKEIQVLQKMREEAKDIQRREERLIISSFYDIGLELQRLMVPYRHQGNPANPASFLAQQRAATNV